MANEVVVTRGSQITLTKEIREKMKVREGDRIILNTMGDILIASKRDSRVFDNFKEFLPGKFDKILKRMRDDEKERLRRLGIIGE